MRAFFPFAIVASFGASLLAQPASAQPVQLPEYVRKSLSDWSGCRAAFDRQHIQSDISARALADASLDACKAQQAEVIAAYSKYFQGPMTASEIATLVEGVRKNSVSAIEMARSGETPQDPAKLWANCVANHTGGVEGEKLSVMVDRAFDQCKDSEQRAVKATQQAYGVESARTIFHQYKISLREEIMRRLKETAEKQ